ncbi:MFS transporter [Microtetraspora malaysiensis]|uniref:MFS transporter n=1 Tax=Microtetraspora malaysiensis TaxID=161358 RepID=UPI003D8D9B4A
MSNRTSPTERLSVLWLALLATPTSLSANTTTTVIPDLARDLGVSAADATWAATAFGWGAAIGTPLVTGLLRRYGLYTAVVVHAVLVAGGTLLVATAPVLPVLLAGRIAQAVGGGGLVTVAIMLAGTSSRTGAVSAGVGLVGAFGPLAGSTLSAVSWRLPLCLSLAALPAVPTVLRRARLHSGVGDTSRTDIPGIALVVGLVSALILLPRSAPHALAAAAMLGALLVWHVRRHPDGFVPQPIVRSRVFLAAAAAACALSTSYFAILYTAPRTMEEHWTAGHTGMAMLAGLAGGSLGSLLFTRRTTRIGARTTQGVVLISGVLAVILSLRTPWPLSAAAAVACAVFAATAAMAWYAARVGALMPASYRQAAVGLFTLAYQLGGAFGPALATLLIT